MENPAAIESAEGPQKALGERLNEDAERLLAVDDPNVRSYTAEDGTAVDEVDLVSVSTRLSRRPTKGDYHYHDGRDVPSLDPYVLTRQTARDGKVRYSLGRPDSSVHHPSNVMGKFERTMFLSWAADGSIEPTDMELRTMAYHARSMHASESWNPHTTMIVEGLDGDRLTRRNSLGRLGAVAAKVRRKWGEREPMFDE